jgi:hypothetical protein
VPTARVAGLAGLLAFATFNVGWIAGDLAQPAAFSPANDDLSDLGASTASSPWLYNQLAANLTGLLVIALGLGLWRAPRGATRGCRPSSPYRRSFSPTSRSRRSETAPRCGIAFIGLRLMQTASRELTTG